MSNFDLNKRLPNELIIQSVDNHLYRSGICFENYGNTEEKRTFIHKPIVIFFAFLLFFIKINLNAIINKGITKLSFIFGDIENLYGIRIEFIFSVNLIAILCIGTQLIYYYNYRNGIKPTFLKVFQMMSGLVSPKSIGLTDRAEILKLIRRTDFLIKFAKINNRIIVPMIVFLWSILPYILYCSPLEIFIFGIPNSILLAFQGYSMVESIINHCIYFELLCYYLEIKTKSLNNSIHKKRNSMMFLRFAHSMDSLFREINEYNNTFWSKLLLLNWLNLGGAATLFLFISLFKSLLLLEKIVFTYFGVFYSSLFLLFIFKASAVNYEVNKSYKSLNSIIAYQSKQLLHKNKSIKLSIKSKIKVIFI